MQRKVLGRGLSALIPEAPAKQSPKNITINISEIDVSELQPRQDTSPQKMEELVASIREKGIIQPLLVRPKAGRYELIAGERRLRAAKSAGVSQLPVIIKDVPEGEALQLALIENIQREDLNALEEAQAYQVLSSQFGLSQEKIARAVGKDSSSISNSLRLLKLPEHIQAALRKGIISMGHARTMLAIKNLEEQGRVFQRTLTQQLSVRELENLVSRRLGAVAKKKRSGQRDPHLVDIEEQLQKILGTRVKIISGRKRGRVILEYYSADDLERILELLKSIK